jgi:hypothetical protein
MDNVTLAEQMLSDSTARSSQHMMPDKQVSDYIAQLAEAHSLQLGSRFATVPSMPVAQSSAAAASSAVSAPVVQYSAVAVPLLAEVRPLPTTATTTSNQPPPSSTIIGGMDAETHAMMQRLQKLKQ